MVTGSKNGNSIFSDREEKSTLRESGLSIVLAFFRPEMGGIQPFLRAVVSIGVAAKLMLVDEPKRQTAARWDWYRPVPKRSETAQLFLVSRGAPGPCAGGPNSSATHPASVRTALPGIKRMLYGNFYSVPKTAHSDPDRSISNQRW